MSIYDPQNLRECPPGLNGNSPWFVSDHCDYHEITLYCLYGLIILLEIPLLTYIFVSTRRMYIIQTHHPDVARKARGISGNASIFKYAFFIVVLHLSTVVTAILRICQFQVGKHWATTFVQIIACSTNFPGAYFLNKNAIAFMSSDAVRHLPSINKLTKILFTGPMAYTSFVIVGVTYIFTVTMMILSTAVTLHASEEDYYGKYNFIPTAMPFIVLSFYFICIIMTSVTLVAFKHSVSGLNKKLSKGTSNNTSTASTKRSVDNSTTRASTTSTSQSNVEAGEKPLSALEKFQKFQQNVDKFVKELFISIIITVIQMGVFVGVPYLRDRLEYYIVSVYFFYILTSFTTCRANTRSWRLKFNANQNDKSLLTSSIINKRTSKATSRQWKSGVVAPSTIPAVSGIPESTISIEATT